MRVSTPRVFSGEEKFLRSERRTVNQSRPLDVGSRQGVLMNPRFYQPSHPVDGLEGETSVTRATGSLFWTREALPHSGHAWHGSSAVMCGLEIETGSLTTDRRARARNKW